ncbi:MAG: PrkA family serine protein kinase [Acidimicrobiia bacterium]|nr:MAG: PrkA family serine protein kinase [Acidimicrobiia bacterium]
MNDDLLDQIKTELADLSEELPFSDYLTRVEENPQLARLSHQLIFDVVNATAQPGSERQMFSDLFGIEPVLRRVVDYLAAGALRLDVRNRILLLVGPPGSGKSTLVNQIKQALETYTRSEDGLVYTIKGCPVQEDPLHLIPPWHRQELPVYVEGDLCPRCRWFLREVHGGAVADIPIVRVIFSQAEGIGVGTFVATDPRSEDLARLVGSVDRSLISEISEDAQSSARRAFRLDGELNAGNRGLTDLIDVFKMDHRFLSVLLTLSQEHTIKLHGPGTLYADEVLIAQSNLAEFEALVADPTAVALVDRLYTVQVPYLLSVRDEMRIYDKLATGAAPGAAHLSPLALRLAATFAVLTRLFPQSRDGWKPMERMRLYEGAYLPGARPGEGERLRSAVPGEGLSGVSPRFIAEQLSRATAHAEACVGGANIMANLADGLTRIPNIDEATREKWSALLPALREEYGRLVRIALQKALATDYDERRLEISRSLGNELEASSAESDPAESPTLVRIDRALNVPQYRRNEFRKHWVAVSGSTPLESEPYFEQAVDALLLPRWNEVARSLRETPMSDPILQRLRGQGFCEVESREILRLGTEMAQPRRRMPGRSHSIEPH